MPIDTEKLSVDLPIYSERDVAVFPFGKENTLPEHGEQYDLFMELCERMEGGDKIAGRTLLAIAAALVECPVPGYVYLRNLTAVQNENPELFSGDVDVEAIYTGVSGYLRAKYYWRTLIRDLEEAAESGNNREMQLLKIDYLRQIVERRPGPVRTKNWPVLAHETDYRSRLAGVGNYVSYAVARIFRDGVSQLQGEITQSGGKKSIDGLIFAKRLTERIIEIRDTQDCVDFVLQVADSAIELGMDPTLVMKNTIPHVFLAGENEFAQLELAIQAAIRNDMTLGADRRYPHLNLS